MRKNPLPTLLALLLVATPVSLTACGTSDSPDKPPVVEHNKVTDKPENQDETQAKEYATVDEQIQAWKDTGILKPTDDPNVWKATKPLPRPHAALKIEKPAYPQAGYQHTQEGAEAVAIYLQPLIAYAFTTGDHEYLRETCSEISSHCNNLVESIKKNEAESEWLAGYAETESQTLGVGLPDGVEDLGEISFRIKFQISTFNAYYAEDNTLRRTPTSVAIRRIGLSYIQGKWVVVALDSEK